MRSDKGKHYSKTGTAKDRVWRYIRRNKLFSFVDAKIVCGINEETLKAILWHLEKAGYIKVKGSREIFLKRTYVHSRERKFGIKSPSLVNGIVYDHNTGDKYDIRATKDIYLPQTLIALLEAMTEDEMTKEEILKKSKVKRDASKRFFRILSNVSIISPALNTKIYKNDNKYKQKDGNRLFEIDVVKVGEALKYILEGNFKSAIGFDLSEVWKESK
jgi:hypothetical protein